MTQKDVIKRILTELITAEIVTDINYDLVQMYLQQTYGAGFDEGRQQKTRRKSVAQYTMDGKLIKIHDSVLIASRVVKIYCTGITRALDNPNKSAAGYIWRSTDKITSASIEKIGTTQLKSILPKQGTHVSKISSV